MLIVISCCVLLIALTTLIHYEILRGVHMALPRLKIPARTKLLVVIFAAFFAHALEIGLYTVTIFGLIRYMDAGTLSGGETTLLDCLYFSAETFTSLGLGDIAPTGPVRLVAGTEALNGLLLIAWSASYTYLSMEKFWTPSHKHASDHRPD
ncbi:MAG: two pore domain potassium channel family protein [Burkholderiaceae bacterium]|nr:two pore domain potassium channel family protein [Burkholderiaceae bacterium]